MSDPSAGQDLPTPFDALGVLASQHVVVGDGVEHHEHYTEQGLLSMLMYPVDGVEPAVLMLGGAMGGLIGGAGLYHELGCQLRDAGISSATLGYRVPNQLEMCTHDAMAGMQLLARRGARRFVTIGHSFGGAIALRAAAAVNRSLVPGVVTLATQSGGCEPAETLGDREILFFHGDSDRILPHMSSEMVRMLTGTGELVLLRGEDHLLGGAKHDIIDRLLDWLPGVLQG